MPPNHAAELISQGEFRQAADWIGSRAALTQSERILKAHVELGLGNSAGARLLAEALLKERLDKPSRAACLDVAGRASARSGAIAEGLTFLQKGVGIAAECSPQLHAELLGHYAKTLLSCVGVEAALTMLPQLRRAAFCAGSSRALVEYHLSLARVAAIRGWWRRAKADIDVARNLLGVEPRLDQLWQLRQVDATMAMLAGQHIVAMLHTKEALDIARSIGSSAFEASSLGNLAYLATLSANYDDARRYVTEASALFSPLSNLRFALYGTQIDIGLWSLDGNYASRAAAAGRTLSEYIPSTGSYYRLWFELQYGRWLLSQGRADEAASLAVSRLSDVETIADKNLSFRMRMLAAEASAETESIDAGIAIADFSSIRTDELSVEALAEMNRIAAILTDDQDSRRKIAPYVSRATRLLTASGLLGPLSDVIRSETKDAITSTTKADDLSKDGIAALEAVALMLALGNHPKVLGGEVLALLQSLDPSLQIQICERTTYSNGEVVVPNGQGAHEIVLGSQNDTTYSLRFGTRLVGGRPAPIAAIDAIVRAALAAKAVVRNDHVELWPQETIATEFGLIVVAESMRELLSTSRKLASSSITVLITGETGTGKELLAKGIHDASPRRERSFIPFNCTAVAREMLDAQLFGYRRGAFTGAQEAFQGVIRAAAGGTLFLDEIGEIGLDVQPKLLRFLESGEIHPLGEPKPIPVDVRVVAATNANLEQLVSEGRFREDLYYRLNVVRLQVPPLRERREEIPPLVQHYLERCVQESRKTGLRFAEETMEYLVLYHWPGNVRQLSNEVKRLVALAEPGAVLMPEHLSHDIRASRRTIPASERSLTPYEVVVRTDQPLAAATEHLERTMVQQALKESSGRLEDAAQRLGLSRKGLYLKRLRLGITEFPDAAKTTTLERPASPEH